MLTGLWTTLTRPAVNGPHTTDELSPIMVLCVKHSLRLVLFTAAVAMCHIGMGIRGI